MFGDTADYTNFVIVFGVNPVLHQLSLWFVDTLLTYTSSGMFFVLFCFVFLWLLRLQSATVFWDISDVHQLRFLETSQTCNQLRFWDISDLHQLRFWRHLWHTPATVLETSLTCTTFLWFLETSLTYTTFVMIFDDSCRVIRSC